MENRQALKLIEKIQKELFKDNFEVSEIVSDLIEIKLLYNLNFVSVFKLYKRIIKTKLTLTVEKVIIGKANSYVKLTGRSLSEIIEKYLEPLTGDEKNEN